MEISDAELGANGPDQQGEDLAIYEAEHVGQEEQSERIIRHPQIGLVRLKIGIVSLFSHAFLPTLG